MSAAGKYILTIGGFDPCNGAGITQDVKTLEALGVYALSVQTCLTIQNEDEVRSVTWTPLEDVVSQIDILVSRYPVDWVKISLIKDLSSLLKVVKHLLDCIPNGKIVWDPVQSSSSGYTFNDQSDKAILKEILVQIYLAMPNWNEITEWESGRAEDVAQLFSAYTNICLKGGHRPGKKGADILYTMDGEAHEFVTHRISAMSKHGSGCVFASALVAGLANEEPLIQAIGSAKDYVTGFIESCPGKLGSHFKMNKMSEKIEN